MSSNFMDSFSNAVTQSVLTRTLANLFAFMLLISALTVCCIEVIAGQPINQYVSIVLGTGIGYSLHLLGLNQGVILTAKGPDDDKAKGNP